MKLNQLPKICLVFNLFSFFPLEIVEGIDVLLKGVDSENEDVDDIDVVSKNALL